MNPYYAVQPQQPMNQYPPVYQQSRRRPRKEKDNTGTYVLVIVGVIAFLLLSAWALGIWPFSPSAATSSSTNPTKDTSAGATPPPPASGSGGVTPPASGSGTPTSTTPSTASDTPTTPLSAIYYGQPFTLKNQWAGIPGGVNSQGAVYLATCDPVTCNGTSTPNVTMKTSGATWKFVNSTTPTSTAAVNYNDNVYVVDSNGNYMTECGDTGSDNAHCATNVVTTKPTTPSQSSLWTIVPWANAPTPSSNTYVSNLDMISLNSATLGTSLSQCGTYGSTSSSIFGVGPYVGPCGWNVSLRTDGQDAGTKGWQISKN